MLQVISIFNNLLTIPLNFSGVRWPDYHYLPFLRPCIACQLSG